MLNIMKKLRSGPETAAAIREALAEVEAAMPAAAEALATAEAMRARRLLTASNAEVERAEATVARERIARDRLEALGSELARRLEIAEAAEATAAIDREVADVRARADKLVANHRARYDRAASQIVELLHEIVATDDAIRALNRRLHDAGRGVEALPMVEDRACRLDPSRHSTTAHSMVALTSLRPGDGQPGYGAGRRAVEVLGVMP